MKRYPRDNPGISLCVHIPGITLGYPWMRGTYPRGRVSRWPAGAGHVATPSQTRDARDKRDRARAGKDSEKKPEKQETHHDTLFGTRSLLVTQADRVGLADSEPQ